ncbi:hypothetical protein NM208_g15188 [Fusarium decemcellulare]|uniref:Uncharacterized protein n=1 Tax=Fusarium decemcellulare TaxID=57161 RepID=A0ACC1RFK2_9HYPO|nr:hypothetical protein NM208_g15188 [Fusarium decemcellulare]
MKSHNDDWNAQNYVNKKTNPSFLSDYNPDSKILGGKLPKQISQPSRRSSNMGKLDPTPTLVPDEDVRFRLKPSNGLRLTILDISTSSDSITSSIADYRQENGRTYHRYKDGKYTFPNDDQENERLVSADMQHHMFLLTFNGRLGLAPPNEPNSKVERVLDVGTGTGIWAMDYGDEHRGAQVVGIDLSPIQPRFVPPNVQFYVDDLEEPWDYPQPFDYIHSRMMTASIASWDKYLSDIFEVRNLAPGGYLELQELDIFAKSDDGSLTADHALSKWLTLIHGASVQLGRPYQDIDGLKSRMAEAGFTDIVETIFKWPMNTWPQDRRYKELGAWHKENMNLGLESFSMALLTRAHGWAKEQVDVLLDEVRKDLSNKRIHAYWPM